MLLPVALAPPDPEPLVVRSPDRRQPREQVRYRNQDGRRATPCRVMDPLRGGWRSLRRHDRVQVPKLREGTNFPYWLLEPRRRAEPAFVQSVAECYVRGV